MQKLSLLHTANNGVNTPLRPQSIPTYLLCHEKNRISQVGEPVSAPLQQNLRQQMLGFSPRRLLTEKSSAKVNPLLLDVQMETLLIRATMVTGFMKEILGYSHFGIND
jgi:hypothetical protein